MKILIDTNFLIYLAKNKLFDDLNALGHEVVIPRVVDFELEKVSQDKNLKIEDRNAASLAQDIVKRFVELKKAKYLDNIEKEADDEILRYAKKTKCIVATMDKELQEKLKKQGNKIIIIRQEKYLELE